MRRAADAVVAGGRGALGDGEEVLLLDDALHEANAERGVAAIHVRDIIRVLLVDFLDDEPERFAQVGVVGFGAYG